MSVNPQGEVSDVASRPPYRAREWTAFAVVAALVFAFYLGTAVRPAGWDLATNKVASDSYNLETAGFRAGHLYLALDPRPELASLADPYDPVQNAPYRAHDLSYFKGHYYMYYGVTPVVVLFWPFALATGRYLSEPAAVALFCAVAVCVGMTLLLSIRRRYYPRAPFSVLVLSWICLGFATPLVLLVQAAQFYQVPIACALCMQALMLGAIYRAMHSESRSLPWMAAAGLFFGLSVGARPNYILGGLVLLAPIWMQAARAKRQGKGPGTALVKAALWAYLPAAVCGAALLYYNWARFGSATEFGVRYMLAGERFTYGNFYGWQFIPRNLAVYLFNFGLWQSYFPFFSAQSRAPYGVLRYLPWCWLALIAIPWGWIRRPRAKTVAEAFAVAVAAAFAVNLLLLAGYVATFYRYSNDFAQAFLLLAGIGALAVGSAGAISGRGRLALVGMASLAAVSIFFSLTSYASWLPDTRGLSGLARLADWPGFAITKAAGGDYGAVRMEIKLPDQAQVAAEPLIETGRQPDQRDWVLLTYLPAGRARLSIFHAGTGLLEGRDFQIPADRRLVVEAQLGSLMPPFDHPVFAGWTLEDYTSAKAEVRLSANGEEVLRTAADCYASSPLNDAVAHLKWAATGTATDFRGKVLEVKRLPLVRPSGHYRLAGEHSTPVELTVYLPAGAKRGLDPLLQTGTGTASDLVYCAYHGEGRISFGLNHYGEGGPESEVMAYDPLVPHKVVVWMGSLAGAPTCSSDGAGANLNRLVVLLDGRPALNLELACYPGDTGPVLVGLNAYGSQGVGRQFSGIVQQVNQVPFDLLPKPEMGAYGAVEMSVAFPDWLPGTQEPLVVTGVTGAGDFMYVRYVDGTHVRFGFDHWGVGGLQGDPIEVDYGKPHRVIVTFQSLYAPGTAMHNSRQVRVTMDGRVVLDATYCCHPSTSAEITIGQNLIGGSTCGDKFNGNIRDIKRVP